MLKKKQEGKQAYSYDEKVERKKYCISSWIVPVDSRRRLVLKMAAKAIRHPRQAFSMLSPRKIRHFFYYLKEEGPGFVSRRIDESIKGVTVEPSVLEIMENAPGKDISSYEPICFVEQENPQVSIIIPVYNQFSYTYNCLKSVLKNSGDAVSYEIIIADDCSADETVRLQELVKNIRVIRNAENLRFLRNCNHAASNVKGKYILFLNNDTQVQKNWLEPLVSLISSDERNGLVGSKLVYPDGKLQEAGGILWKDGSAWNYGNGSDPDAPEYNYVKETDYISGASIMIRADLWKEIGGFDEQFAPAYYEDTDLAFEVRRRGYKVLYQPRSMVVHFEGVSNGTDVQFGQKKYMADNQKKFFAKWRHELTGEHFENGTNLFLARDRSRNKKVLLVVDHYVPMYDKDAGSRCMFYYLKLFRKMGYTVKFIGDNYYKHEPYTATLQQMGIEVLYGNFYYDNWKGWIRSNGRFFDYALLSRPHISVKYIDIIRESSPAKIIYFGHDLHFLRTLREYRLSGDEQALKDSKEWEKKELELMHKADVSYYFSNAELEEIKKTAPDVNVRRVPINIYEDIPDVSYHADERKDIIFVGGFGHPPNVDAVCWLGNEIMPLIWKNHPEITLHVVGSKPPNEIKAFAGGHMLIHGFVPDEELEKMYQNIRLAIVPLRYGAGIKGKIIEAMMRGVPMVTTDIGIEGIEGAEKITRIGNSAKELAETIVSAYYDQGQLEKMSKDERQYIINNYSIKNAVEILT